MKNFFFMLSIGIDETNTFQFFISMKIVGATDLVALWALEWAWHIRVTNMRCAQGIKESKSEIPMFQVH